MTRPERTFWTLAMLAWLCGGSSQLSAQSSSVPPVDVNDPQVQALIADAERGINVCGTGVGQTMFTIDAHLITSYNGFGVSCFGECDGAVEVTVTGGMGPFTYQWIGGPATPVWNNVCAANQIVLVTDQGQGITCAVTVDVTDPPRLTVVFSNPQPPTCAAICNGSASVFALGGVSPYVYNWNNGTEFGQLPTQLCVGQNTLLITDDNNCTFDTTFTLSTQAVQANEVVTDVSCFGVCDGSVVINATGGTPPLTFDWTPDPPNGDGNPLATGLCAGPVSVTITDNNGCDTTLNLMIQEPVQIDPNLTTSDASCSDVCDGTASVNPNSGAGSFSYDWSPGAPVGDSTPDVTGLCPGTWSVTITDNTTSCDTTLNFVIGAPPGIDPSFTSTDVTCFGDCDGTISFNPSGGTPPYGYTWNPVPPNGDGISNGSDLCAGDWTITVSDALGCDTTLTITVNEPDALVPNETFTDVTCFGEDDGTIDLLVSGGTPPYDYIWTPPAPVGNGTPNVSGLTAGDWTVTISDDNDCDTTLTITISEPPPVQVNPTVTEIGCNNVCNGAISLGVSGGTPGYNFTWTPTPPVGDGTDQVSGLCAGTWSVVITDASDCELQQQFTLQEPDEFTITLTAQDATCGNSCDGSATAVVSGGAPDYDYLWDPAPGQGQGTAQPTGMCPGSYMLTITDDNNCDSIITFDIGPATGILPNETVIPATCADQCDGSITFAPTGGVAPFTYLWNPAPSGGPDVAGAIDLCPDTYTITITDDAGCDTTLVIEIMSPPAIDVQVASTDATCAGDDDGTIDLTISGGTPPFDVQWSPVPGQGQGTPNVSDLGAGTWTATITDDVGCDTVIMIDIMEPFAIDPDLTFTQPTCGGGCDGMADLNPTGGTGLITAFWVPEPPEGQGVLSSTQLCPGTYNITLTDENNCDTTITFELLAPVAPMVTSVVVNTTCSDTCDGIIELTVIGAVAPTFNWSPAPPIGDGTNFGQGLCAGPYTIAVSDQGVCDTTLILDISAPAPLDVAVVPADVLCAGECTGTCELPTITGGTPPYNIIWAPYSGPGQGTTNVNDLCAGNYTVQIIDDNGCDTIIPFTINEPLAVDLGLSFTQPTCGGGCDGTAGLSPIGGTGLLTVFWVPEPPEGQGVLSSTQLCPDTYNITITDDNGCDTTVAFELIDPNAPIVQPTVTNTSCGNVCDGSIDLTVSGVTSATFAWSPAPPVGDGTPNVSGLCAITYTVTVTDVSGCDTTLMIPVGSPDPILPNETWTDETCNGPCDGTITLNPTGGDGNYSVVWTPMVPGGGLSVSGLCAGAYMAQLSDGNGCDTIVTVMIGATQPIAANFSGIDVSCPGACDGIATVDPVGGTPPYDYIWSPQPPFGQGTDSVSGLCAGSWSVLISDAVDCDTTIQFDIQKPSFIVPGLAVENEDCTGPCTGGASVAPFGAFGGPFTITWSPLPAGNTQGNDSIFNACAGSYTVNIADVMGCDTTVMFDIGPFPPFQVVMATTPSNCAGDCDGTAQSVVTGGEQPYTYTWTPAPPGGQQGNPLVTGLCADSYTLLVTDNSGCDTTIFFDITAPTPLNVSANVDDLTCSGQCNGEIIVNITGGTMPYNYLWDPVPPTGQFSNEISDLCAGDWTLFLTDTNGCDTAITYTITEPDPLVITTTLAPSHCQVCDGGIIVEVTGGTPDYTYSWTDQNGAVISTNDTLTDLCAGIYTLTLTDDQGCELITAIPLDDDSGEDLSVIDGSTNCDNNCDGEVTVDFDCLDPLCTVVWYDINGTPIGQTDTTATGLCVGLYIAEVTNASGCISYDTAQVIAPPPFDVLLDTAHVTCNSAADGSASVLVTGGAGTLDYLWSPGNINGQGTSSVTDLAPGSYTVTITDRNQCDTTIAFDITEPGVLDPGGVVLDATCVGDSDGEVVLNITGGTPDYVINWDPVPPNGNGTIEAFDLIPGTYMVTVTDANGCDSTATYVVGSNPPVVLSTSSTDSECQVCNGTALVNITSGSPPYSITWTDDNGAVVDNDTLAESLCAGLYTVFVSDQENCSATQTVPVSDSDGEVLAASATPTSCLGNCDGTVDLSFVCSDPPCVTTWYGPAGDTLAQNVNMLDSLCVGTYIVGVVNASGCVSFDTTQVMQGDELIPNLSTTPVSCANACDGTATVNPTGGIGPYVYVWTDQQGDTLAQNGTSVGPLCAGTYAVNITDITTGCFIDQGVLILEPPAFSINTAVTHVACGGECTGSIAINSSGGTGQHSYSWSPAPPTPNQPDASTITDLCAGPWTVTITDATGCDTSITYMILEPPPLVLTAASTQSNCQICDGMAVVTPSGGETPYQYEWSDGTSVIGTDSLIPDLCAGLYSVTVTDANNCTAMAGVPVTDLDGEMLTTTDGLTTCADSCDGSVSVSFTCSVQPCTITWSDVLGTQIATDTMMIDSLCAGDYIVTVLNGDGCTSVDTATVVGAPSIMPNLTTTPIFCNDSCNASATVAPSGGAGGYQFIWSPDPINGQGTNMVTDLCAGNYSIQVLDANSCSVIQNFTINDPAPIDPNAVVMNAMCNGSCNGSIALSPSGGTAPYTYQWTPLVVPGDSTATDLCPGDYTVTITDLAGCDTTITYTIIDQAPILINISTTDNVCFNDCEGTAMAVFTGGVPPYTIEWQDMNGSAFATDTNQVSGLCNGQYMFSITDSTGCQALSPFSIGSAPAIEANLSITSETCMGPCDGTATINPTGGSGPLTIVWSGNPVGQGTNQVSGLCAGAHSVTLTDTLNCDTTYNFIILPYTGIAANALVDSITCSGFCDGEIILNPTGGVAPYTYFWDPPPPLGQGTSTISNLCGGTWDVTVTDSVGCDTMFTFTLTDPPLLEVNIDQTVDATCSTSNDGSIAITITGGVGQYDITWNGPGTFTSMDEDITGLLPGTYVVQVVDDNNCQVNAPATINALTVLIADAGEDTSVCVGSSVLPTAAGSVGGTAIVWTDMAGNQLGTDTILNMVNFQPGSYDIILTISDGTQCVDMDTVQITVQTGPPADAGPDQNVLPGTVVQLGGSPTGPAGSTFSWSPDSILDDPFSATPNATVDATALFTVVVSSPVGCTSVDQVLIEIIPEFEIPSGFSPNGDAWNDTWEIDLIDQFPNVEVRIFNRWGEMLFESNGYFDPWDGTYEGEPVPTGTYYYAIELNDPQYPDPFTGPLTVLR